MEKKETKNFKFTFKPKRPLNADEKKTESVKSTPKPKNQKRPFDAEENHKEFYQSLNEQRESSLLLFSK